MKKYLAAFAVFLLVSGLAAHASALSLDYGDDWYIGQIVDGTPSSPSLQADYINYLKELDPGDTPVQLPDLTGETYDRINSTFSDVDLLPDADVLESYKQDNNSTTLLWGSSYAWIYGKYGGEAWVWYIGDYTFEEGEIVTLAQTPSHTSGYNRVPEPSSMFLLGTGLIGLAALRIREFKK